MYLSYQLNNVDSNPPYEKVTLDVTVQGEYARVLILLDEIREKTAEIEQEFEEQDSADLLSDVRRACGL